MILALPLTALTLLAAEPGKSPITAQTAASGGPLDPSQERVRFDSADLAIEVFPEREAIAGTATLNFTAKVATDRLAIDLDRNYTISVIAVDGRPLAPSAWRNPEGRIFLTLPRRVAAGQKLAVRISYAGRPHVAVRAPWDGGFVWNKTPAGQPWVATAVQMEGCDLIWPCIDYPTYEPDQIDVHITVPAGLKAVSKGVARGESRLPEGTHHLPLAGPAPPGGRHFPLPVEVSVDGVVSKVDMSGGTGSITVPAAAHVVVDPMSRMLMQSDEVDAFQAYRAEQMKKP